MLSRLLRTRRDSRWTLDRCMDEVKRLNSPGVGVGAAGPEDRKRARGAVRGVRAQRRRRLADGMSPAAPVGSEVDDDSKLNFGIAAANALKAANALARSHRRSQQHNLPLP